MAKLLSEQQRRQYRDQGIVYPIRVLSAEDVDRFRNECDKLEARLGGKPRTIEVRQMHLHFRWAYDLATHPRVLDAVEDLLGPNLLVWATELFTKHPHETAVSIGFHRDRPYMGFAGGAAVTTAWIALTDSMTANGCMLAVPGLKQGASVGVQPSGCDVHAKACTPTSGVTAVVLEAGEMSLHDIDILHGSNANNSSRKRMGFVVRYVASGARPENGRPPAILARGRDIHHHFQIVDPPDENDSEQSLTEMQESAMRHFKAMLGNVERANS